jgi:plasmid stabilization system protein ParE
LSGDAPFSETCLAWVSHGLRCEGLRLLPAGNYLILYYQVGEDAEIVRVVHGARRWQDLL